MSPFDGRNRALGHAAASLRAQTRGRRARRRALLSVADKQGLAPFATAPAKRSGFEIVSPRAAPRKRCATPGFTVTDVSNGHRFSGNHGRPRQDAASAHPRRPARRGAASTTPCMAQHGIGPIDLLVVNLYPFEATTARPDCTDAEAIENIDVGGPAMLRAAAKNHEHIAVVVDPRRLRRPCWPRLNDGGVPLDDATRSSPHRKPIQPHGAL